MKMGPQEIDGCRWQKQNSCAVFTVLQSGEVTLGYSSNSKYSAAGDECRKIWQANVFSSTFKVVCQFWGKTKYPFGF